MKKRKKPIALFLIMSMVIMLIFPTGTPVSFARKKTVKLKKITLNHSTYKLQKGKSLKLKASFKPKKTTQKKIQWKSSKKSVAKVSKKGVVKAVKVGKATITAKVKGTKKKATCKIQVVLKTDNGSKGNGNNIQQPNTQINPPESNGGTNGTTPTDQPDSPLHSPSVPDVTPSAPVLQPSETPTITEVPSQPPTKAPTKNPSSPAATPKYERPAVTAPPVKYLDLTAEGTIHNESPSKSTIVNNPDGSVTITFLEQYGALNFFLPDNAQNYYSNYKSIVITYTSEGGNLGHALYDTEMVGPENSSAGKHPFWDKQIVESKVEKTLVLTVSDDCVGGCIRGFQIFSPDKTESGKPITITIKSIAFCDKEDPSEEDLKPGTTPVVTEKPTLPPLITREPGLYGINGPVNQGNDIVWDSVTFGSYFQNLYEPEEIVASPVEGQEYTDSNGTVMIYKGGSYYKKEPIRWRVLSVNEDDALLIAEQNLDTIAYHDQNSSSVSWEESTIRHWLNEDFYSSAFTDQDKSTIIAQENDTVTDQVYLLSTDEVKEMGYGFAIHHENKSSTRQAKNTAYAKKNGAWTNSEDDYAGNGWWWLRNIGSLPFDAAYVGSEGFTDCSGFIAVNTGGGVRPALHINLKSVAWESAGKITVSSAEDLLPTPAPTENPQKKITLSAVRIDPSSCGSYNIDTDTVNINDTRTSQGDSTFMYFPNPITVKAGERIKVTISGPKWGSNDFRIWTTPSNDTGNGSVYAEDPNVYLNPTIQPDGSYSGTVEIAAKAGECNCLSLKAGYGVKIQDLIISEIIVERVNTP